MTQLLQYLNWAYIPGTLMVAAIWGGRCERIAVGLFVLAIISTHFATTEFTARYSSVEQGVLFVDLLLAGALIALAIKSDRFWPIWASSFHLLSVYTHIAMFLPPMIVAFPYAFLAAWWAWPTQASLVIGVFEHRQQRRRGLNRTG
ncbi:hypothetical protein [Sphingobium sp. CCH11-B1]|uniref:hypothetical protein n=1 Tax=Sphingobium sp. CCH11-B1 TaxID=1768781 RepID=UPI000832F24E|nr:hypothetical protein [Sphingobium sp. CCH11-B1]MEA3390336.1 hypothetical protein [Pseudomonadota bacterium]